MGRDMEQNFPLHLGALLCQAAYVIAAGCTTASILFGGEGSEKSAAGQGGAAAVETPADRADGAANAGAASDMASVAYEVVIDPSGLGHEHMTAVREASDLLQEGKADDAVKKLDAVLAAFGKLMAVKQGRYVCFRAAKQFDDYAAALGRDKGGGAVKSLQRLSWAYCEALHLKAYLAASAGLNDEAMVLLRKAIEHAPYAPGPHCERGFLFNQLKRYQSALACYRMGLDLAKRHGGSAGEQAIALRGIGFSQIELKDLSGARASFEQSLTLDPESELAQNEIAYIDAMLARQDKAEGEAKKVSSAPEKKKEALPADVPDTR